MTILISSISYQWMEKTKSKITLPWNESLYSKDTTNTSNKPHQASTKGEWHWNNTAVWPYSPQKRA